MIPSFSRIMKMTPAELSEATSALAYKRGRRDALKEVYKILQKVEWPYYMRVKQLKKNIRRELWLKEEKK